MTEILMRQLQIEIKDYTQNHYIILSVQPKLLKVLFNNLFLVVDEGLYTYMLVLLCIPLMD